jgi:hypothetical protein
MSQLTRRGSSGDEPKPRRKKVFEEKMKGKNIK